MSAPSRLQNGRTARGDQAMTRIDGPTIEIEGAVATRYTRGAHEREAALCCPVEYDARYLEVIPPEIVERDYGCGDPSQDLRPGEVVLDLGSGAGKICYIAAQIVGSTGRVIGVDMNDAMLALARKYQRDIAGRLAYDNVQFHRARIQDLQTDVDAMDAYLERHPVTSFADLQAFERFRRAQRDG